MPGSDTTDDGLLSVVIACFDATDTIGEQVAALAAQDDDGPWEAVFSDNGSTDGTRELLARLAAEHPHLRLRVVDGSGRRGAGPARNAGVRAAEGGLIAFCDADDVVDRGWVRAVRAGLARHDFLAGRFEGGALNEPWMTKARRLDQSTGLQSAAYSPWLPHAGAGNLAIRRELFEAVGGFDPDCRYLQDNDLCWRVQLATGARLAFWPDAVVHVRLRGDLPGMWLQGLHYGGASAWLQQRYAVVAPLDVRPEPERAAGRRRRLDPRRYAWLVPSGLDRGSLGRFLWQAGWRVGYRGRRHGFYRPGVAPTPLPPTYGREAASA